MVLLDRLDDQAVREWYAVRDSADGWPRAGWRPCWQPAAPAPGCRAVELPDDLAAADSDLVQEITRDPYVFDFVRLQPGYRELDVQAALVADLRRLLV